jgi:hypothetical protein
MPGPGDHPNAEERITELKASLDKYLSGAEKPTAEALAEVTKAVHDLADHVVELQRRFERVEGSLPEWTNEGWQPAPGGDVAEDR